MSNKMLAVGIGLNMARGQVVTIEQEFYWDKQDIGSFAQRIHDCLANEVIPAHALIQEIILLENGDESYGELEETAGKCFPRVIKKLRGNIDYTPKVFT